MFGITQMDFDFFIMPGASKEVLMISTIIGWSVPTMFTIVSFSVFAYYIAKLNILIEESNSQNQKTNKKNGPRSNASSH